MDVLIAIAFVVAIVNAIANSGLYALIGFITGILLLLIAFSKGDE